MIIAIGFNANAIILGCSYSSHAKSPIEGRLGDRGDRGLFTIFIGPMAIMFFSSPHETS